MRRRASIVQLTFTRVGEAGDAGRGVCEEEGGGGIGEAATVVEGDAVLEEGGGV